MARVNETRITSIVYEDRGFEYRPMVAPELAPTRAKELAAQGMQNVTVLVERVTWRGKNGARHRETLSETRY